MNHSLVNVSLTKVSFLVSRNIAFGKKNGLNQYLDEATCSFSEFDSNLSNEIHYANLDTFFSEIGFFNSLSITQPEIYVHQAFINQSVKS